MTSWSDYQLWQLKVANLHVFIHPFHVSVKYFKYLHFQLANTKSVRLTFPNQKTPLPDHVLCDEQYFRVFNTNECFLRGGEEGTTESAQGSLSMWNMSGNGLHSMCYRDR